MAVMGWLQLWPLKAAGAVTEHAGAANGVKAEEVQAVLNAAKDGRKARSTNRRATASPNPATDGRPAKCMAPPD